MKKTKTQKKEGLDDDKNITMTKKGNERSKQGTKALTTEEPARYPAR